MGVSNFALDLIVKNCKFELLFNFLASISVHMENKR